VSWGLGCHQFLSSVDDLIRKEAQAELFYSIEVSCEVKRFICIELGAVRQAEGYIAVRNLAMFFDYYLLSAVHKSKSGVKDLRGFIGNVGDVSDGDVEVSHDIKSPIQFLFGRAALALS